MHTKEFQFKDSVPTAENLKTIGEATQHIVGVEDTPATLEPIARIAKTGFKGVRSRPTTITLDQRYEVVHERRPSHGGHIGESSRDFRQPSLLLQPQQGRQAALSVSGHPSRPHGAPAQAPHIPDSRSRHPSCALEVNSEPPQAADFPRPCLSRIDNQGASGTRTSESRVPTPCEGSERA